MYRWIVLVPLLFTMVRAADPKAPEKLDIPGIENAFRLSPNLYSGGDPHGEAALGALKKLGVKTIVSVDGVAPEVATAKRLGMRYVHLPIGYDGVPRDQAVRLVRTMKTLPGPVYVHCHHGMHRGPASAAVCGLASEGWTKKQAADWLKLAGTSIDYAGLYASVQDFVPPTAKELDAVGADLPEVAEIDALVELMVKVDRRWDAFKALQKAEFRAKPGVDPRAEALQLVELFRESARLPESQAKGEAFLKRLNSAEGHANALYEAAGKPNSRQALEAAFAEVGKSCKSCHAKHRDPARP